MTEHANTNDPDVPRQHPVEVGQRVLMELAANPRLQPEIRLQAALALIPA